ncbi:MAG: helix-turn-helix domain-containing protein [Proteobacteria bacterium]|jgi:transcriptional regulator with XRE-family HTH domain|nr:helix-turn-helix domain-containing protein [Pseudomonadota bacterium]
MQPVTKNKNESVANVLKRLRENARLTTRQAASIVGVTHTTISHFENGKRAVEGFRVEQMVRAYGYTMEQFDKIAGNNVVQYEQYKANSSHNRSIIRHRNGNCRLLGL